MGLAHPEHEIGAALHSLQVGQTVQVKGPFGSFRYQPGKYKAIGARCQPAHDRIPLLGILGVHAAAERAAGRHYRSLHPSAQQAHGH